jgi:hypothetical protein
MATPEFRHKVCSSVLNRQKALKTVSNFPGGIRLSQLVENVADRFGNAATYQTDASSSMDLDASLITFEVRESIRIINRIIYPASAHKP